MKPKAKKGFYAVLPTATINLISKLAQKHDVPQWQVVDAAINKRKLPARKRVAVVNVEL